MAYKITVLQLYQAMPALRKIAKARLSPKGAMSMAMVMKPIEDAYEIIEEARLQELRKHALLDEEGNVVYKQVQDENGKTIKQAVYKTPEDEQAMNAFGDHVSAQEIELPYHIKTDYLMQVPGRPETGYNLSVEECLQLGAILSYKGVPVPNEDEE